MEDQIKEAEQLGVRAGQLGVHDDCDILDGNFSLVFGIQWIGRIVRPFTVASLTLKSYSQCKITLIYL